jgi:D-serine deaminase-like pyridoxal phosphate-dependent protein
MADELPAGKRGYAVAEINTKIARAGKPEGLFKADLPTPALLVDLDVLERNIAQMARYVSTHGKQLRPHGKTHKCVNIARRQIAAGAAGVCVATVAEAVVMAGGGIDNILLTSPIASDYKAAQLAELARERTILAAVDHPTQAARYDQAAAAAGTTVNVLVDVNTGDRRTGSGPGELPLTIARQVAQSKHLRLRGIQAYSGSSSHVVGFLARQAYSREAMLRAADVLSQIRAAGLPAEMFSGASTGTHNIDGLLEPVTELQAGSYVCMDVDYRKIGSATNDVFDDFGVALTVLATVVSANHANRATIDAGFKAFATDRKFGPEAKDVTGLNFAFGGDEFGILTWEQTSRPIALGDRLEFVVPHCDPTVNLYDRIYACRGDKVEEIWSVMNRLPVG